jgi:hypothetical protein
MPALVGSQTERRQQVHDVRAQWRPYEPPPLIQEERKEIEEVTSPSYRHAPLLLGLERAGVDFIAANANRMEGRMIAARTRAALAAAKARGVVLGGWRGGPKVDGQLGAEANKKQAEAFAVTLAPVIAEMHTRGLTLRQIAGELRAQGIRMPRGGQWSASGVRNVLPRLAPASA